MHAGAGGNARLPCCRRRLVPPPPPHPVQAEAQQTESVDAINAWAERVTKGLIKTALPPGTPFDMVLTNAVYFKVGKRSGSSWVQQAGSSQTPCWRLRCPQQSSRACASVPRSVSRGPQQPQNEQQPQRQAAPLNELQRLQRGIMQWSLSDCLLCVQLRRGCGS